MILKISLKSVCILHINQPKWSKESCMVYMKFSHKTGALFLLHKSNLYKIQTRIWAAETTAQIPNIVSHSTKAPNVTLDMLYKCLRVGNSLRRRYDCLVLWLLGMVTRASMVEHSTTQLEALDADGNIHDVIIWVTKIFMTSFNLISWSDAEWFSKMHFLKAKIGRFLKFTGWKR